MPKRPYVTISSSPPPVASSSKRLKPSSPDDDDGVINLVSSSPVPRRQSKPAALVATSSGDSFGPTQQRKSASKERVKQSKRKSKGSQKLPMWDDLMGIKKGWRKRRGELRGLPLEVMDRIVSYDSDLDLADHLALAGTCRSFRTFYRDVVFQVLFAYHYPTVRLPAHLVVISHTGTITLPFSTPFIGPVLRSPFEARKIFTNDACFSTDSPTNHIGWGVPNDVWATDPRRRDDLALVQSLAKDRTAYELEVRKEEARRVSEETFKWETKVRRMAGEKAVESDFVIGCGKRPEQKGEGWVENMVKGKLSEQIDVYGEWIDTTGSIVNPNATRDPWESGWRQRVADVVNKTLLHKTDAMRTYRLTKEQMEYLLPRLHPDTRTHLDQPMHFNQAAASSLALRLHKGVTGHKEHVEKVEAKVAKQQETRARNILIAQEEAEETARIKAMERNDGFLLSDD